jgi:hypothetical protein
MTTEAMSDSMPASDIPDDAAIAQRRMRHRGPLSMLVTMAFGT